MSIGGILGVRVREILLFSSSTLPGFGGMSTKIDKLTDPNAPVPIRINEADFPACYLLHIAPCARAVILCTYTQYDV